MKNRHLFQKAAALLLLAALACPLSVHAMAVEEWQSTKTTYRYAGYNYDGWTILYHDHDGKYRSSAWIQEQNFSSLPAKYMGVSAEIRNTEGRILASAPVKYSSTGDSWTWQEASAVRGIGTIYSAGKVHLFNGVKEVVYDLPESDNVNTEARAAAVSALAETLTAEGTYPANARGQTYGSTELSGIVGCEPDLIAAVGIDGTEGYVLKTDVRPEFRSCAEIEAYQRAMDARTDCTIPLYDAEGSEIGRFQYGREEKEISEDVRRTIDLLKENYQAYMEQVREDILERRSVVRVLNQEGIDGFCRRRDMEPSWGLTHEECLEYIKVQDTRTYFAAPIYDEEGNKIGMFDMSAPGKPSAAAQREIDRLKAAEAAAIAGRS